MRGGVGMAQGMPGGMFRMRRVPGMRVRMVRIDLKALLQVAVAAWVLYQVSPTHMCLLICHCWLVCDVLQVLPLWIQGQCTFVKVNAVTCAWQSNLGILQCVGMLRHVMA